MAKMLKQLVFGQKKNPPAPPRPDYDGDKLSKCLPYEGASEVPFFDHNYENLPKFGRRATDEVCFADKEPEVVLLENYSEPLDARRSPDPGGEGAVEESGGLPEDEDMYCLPYDPPTGVVGGRGEEEECEYDVVPREEEEEDEDEEGGGGVLVCGGKEEDEYDEPWEWSVGARLTHSLQVQFSPPLEEEEGAEEEGMSERRQRRLLYETAFDSTTVNRDAEDLEGPLAAGHHPDRSGSPSSQGGAVVGRAASRSSFGSTSGSSASSTPTHHLHRSSAPRCPRPRPLPEERRRVVLTSASQPLIPQMSFERRIISLGGWEEKGCGSEGEESMQEACLPGGRSSPAPSVDRTQECSKVEPLEKGRRRHRDSGELKENDEEDVRHPRQRRPSSLLSCEVMRPTDNLPTTTQQHNQQSPENDVRSLEGGGAYDPPWDLRKRSTNHHHRKRAPTASTSVPERLSTTHQHTDEDSVVASCRPNVNSCDSPRKVSQRPSLSLNFGCAALTTLGEKVDPQITLEKQSWYHGSISRVDAEAKLRVLKEGSYLVRNSESSKQDYSLSLKSARGFMHMKIVPTEGGRFILGQFSNPFDSIPEMIRHYSINKLPIKGAEHMSLLYPVLDQLL